MSYCQKVITKKFNLVNFDVVLLEANEMIGSQAVHCAVQMYLVSIVIFTPCLNQWFKTSAFTPMEKILDLIGRESRKSGWLVPILLVYLVQLAHIKVDAVACLFSAQAHSPLDF